MKSRKDIRALLADALRSLSGVVLQVSQRRDPGLSSGYSHIKDGGLRSTMRSGSTILYMHDCSAKLTCASDAHGVLTAVLFHNSPLWHIAHGGFGL